MTKRTLNKAAPELLQAAKSALRLLLASPPHKKTEIDQVTQSLASAIDKAEGIDPSLGTITFVVTPKTAKDIATFISEGGDGPLADLVSKSTRFTARRAYIKLDADISLMRELKTIFGRRAPSYATGEVFRRLSTQIDRQVLSKSPLEFLAEAGF